MDHPSFRSENSLFNHRSMPEPQGTVRAELSGGQADKTTEGGADNEYYMVIIVQLLEALGYDVEAIARMLGHIERKELGVQIKNLEDSKVISSDLANRLKQLHRTPEKNLNDQARHETTGGHNLARDFRNGVPGAKLGGFQQSSMSDFKNSPKVGSHVQRNAQNGIASLLQSPPRAQAAGNDSIGYDALVFNHLIELEDKLKGEAYAVLLGCKQLAAPHFLSSLKSSGPSMIDLTGLLTAARRNAGSEAVRLLELVLRGQSQSQSWEENTNRIASFEQRVQELLKENMEHRQKLFRNSDELEKAKRDNLDLKSKLEAAMIRAQNNAFMDNSTALKSQIEAMASKLKLPCAENGHLDMLKQIENAYERSVNTNMRLQAAVDGNKSMFATKSSIIGLHKEDKLHKLENDLNEMRSLVESMGLEHHIPAFDNRSDSPSLNAELLKHLTYITKAVQKELVEIKEKEVITKYVPVQVNQYSSNDIQSNPVANFGSNSSIGAKNHQQTQKTEQVMTNQNFTTIIHDQTKSNRTIYFPPSQPSTVQFAWKMPQDSQKQEKAEDGFANLPFMSSHQTYTQDPSHPVTAQSNLGDSQGIMKPHDSRYAPYQRVETAAIDKVNQVKDFSSSSQRTIPTSGAFNGARNVVSGSKSGEYSQQRIELHQPRHSAHDNPGNGVRSWSYQMGSPLNANSFAQPSRLPQDEKDPTASLAQPQRLSNANGATILGSSGIVAKEAGHQAGVVSDQKQTPTGLTGGYQDPSSNFRPSMQLSQPVTQPQPQSGSHVSENRPPMSKSWNFTAQNITHPSVTYSKDHPTEPLPNQVASTPLSGSSSLQIRPDESSSVGVQPQRVTILPKNQQRPLEQMMVADLTIDKDIKKLSRGTSPSDSRKLRDSVQTVQVRLGITTEPRAIQKPDSTTIPSRANVDVPSRQLAKQGQASDQEKNIDNISEPTPQHSISPPIGLQLDQRTNTDFTIGTRTELPEDNQKPQRTSDAWLSGTQDTHGSENFQPGSQRVPPEVMVSLVSQNRQLKAESEKLKAKLEGLEAELHERKKVQAQPHASVLPGQISINTELVGKAQPSPATTVEQPAGKSRSKRKIQASKSPEMRGKKDTSGKPKVFPHPIESADRTQVESLAEELEEAQKKVKKLKKETKKKDEALDALKKELEYAHNQLRVSAALKSDSKLADNKSEGMPANNFESVSRINESPQNGKAIGSRNLDESPKLVELRQLRDELASKSAQVTALEEQIDKLKQQKLASTNLSSEFELLKGQVQAKDDQIKELRKAISNKNEESEHIKSQLELRIQQKENEINDFKKNISYSKQTSLNVHPGQKGPLAQESPGKLGPAPNSDRESKMDESHLFHLSKDSDRMNKDASVFLTMQSDKGASISIEQLQKQILQLKADLALKDGRIADLEKTIEILSLKMPDKEIGVGISHREKSIEIANKVATKSTIQTRTESSDKASTFLGNKEVLEELASLLSFNSDRDSKSSKSKSQTSKRSTGPKQFSKNEQIDAHKVLDQVKRLRARASSLENDIQQKDAEINNLNKKYNQLKADYDAKLTENQQLHHDFNTLKINLPKISVESMLEKAETNKKIHKKSPINNQVTIYNVQEEERPKADSFSEFTQAVLKNMTIGVSSNRDNDKKPPAGPSKNQTSADNSRKEGDRGELRRSRLPGMEHQNTLVSFPGTEDSQFQVNELLEDIKKLQEAKDQLQGMVEKLLKSEDVSKIMNDRSQHTIEGEVTDNQRQVMSLRDSPINLKDSPIHETNINVDHLEQRIYDKLNLISQLQEKIIGLESENSELKEIINAAKIAPQEERLSAGGKSSKGKSKPDITIETKKILEILPASTQDLFKKMDEESKRRLMTTSFSLRDDLDKSFKQEILASEIKLLATVGEKDIIIDQLKSQIESVQSGYRAATSELIEARKASQLASDLQVRLEDMKHSYREVQEENRNMIEALEEIRQQINDGRIIIKEEQPEDISPVMAPKTGDGGLMAVSASAKPRSQKKISDAERSSVNSQKAKSSTKSTGQPKQGMKKDKRATKSFKSKEYESASDLEPSKSGRVVLKADREDISNESDVHELLRQTTAELGDLQKRYNALQEQIVQHSASCLQTNIDHKAIMKEIEEFKVKALFKENLDEIQQLQAIEAQMHDEAKTEEELITENAELIEFMKKASIETNELKEKYFETIEYLDNFIKQKLTGEGSSEGFLDALDQEQTNAPKRTMEQLKQFNHGLWEAVLNQRRKMNNLAKRIHTIERWSDDKEIGRPDTERMADENLDLPYEKLPASIKSVEAQVAAKKSADQSNRRESCTEEGIGTIPSVSTDRQQRGDIQLSNEVLVDLLLSIVGLTEELRHASYQDDLPDEQKVALIREKLDNFEIVGENGGLDIANIQRMIQNTKDQESQLLFHETHEITEVSPEEEDDEDSKRARSSKRQGSLARLSRKGDSARRGIDSKGTSSEVGRSL